MIKEVAVARKGNRAAASSVEGLREKGKIGSGIALVI